MIKGEELQNRAEEMTPVAAAEVADEAIPKPPRGAEAADDAMRKMRGGRQPKAAEADELARLAAKIRNAIAAVRIQRAPRGIPDGASWGMGRDAAAAAIEAALGGQ